MLEVATVVAGQGAVDSVTVRSDVSNRFLNAMPNRRSDHLVELVCEMACGNVQCEPVAAESPVTIPP